MNDDALGRLGRALLDDLERTQTDEGRLLAVTRVLAHVHGAGARDAVEAREASVSWPCLAKGFGEGPPPSAAEVEARASAACGVSQRLLDTAPGPITRYARSLALIAGQAQFAIQWGEIAEMRRVMAWLAGFAFSMRTVPVPGLEVGELPWGVVGALATMGAVGPPPGFEPQPQPDANEPPSDRPPSIVRHEWYDPEMCTGFARRTCANFAAIARAAARAEGKPECDQRFWLEDAVGESMRGLPPYQARLCVSQIAALLLEPAIAPLPADVKAMKKFVRERPAPSKTDVHGLEARSAAAHAIADRWYRAHSPRAPRLPAKRL